MFGQTDVTTGTRGVGTCYQCARETPMSDLFSCTTCKVSTATANDAVSIRMLVDSFLKYLDKNIFDKEGKKNYGCYRKQLRRLQFVSGIGFKT